MKLVNHTFVLDDEKVSLFREMGALKLDNFFCKDSLLGLKENIISQFDDKQDKFSGFLNRSKYDLVLGNDFISSLCKSVVASNCLRKLTHRKLFLTQIISFELSAEKDKGFPWHTGGQSLKAVFRELKIMVAPYGSP